MKKTLQGTATHSFTAIPKEGSMFLHNTHPASKTQGWANREMFTTPESFLKFMQKSCAQAYQLWPESMTMSMDLNSLNITATNPPLPTEIEPVEELLEQLEFPFKEQAKEDHLLPPTSIHEIEQAESLINPIAPLFNLFDDDEEVPEETQADLEKDLQDGENELMDAIMRKNSSDALDNALKHSPEEDEFPL